MWHRLPYLGEKKTMTVQGQSKGNYGLDAPLIIRNLMIAALVCLLSALLDLAEFLSTWVGTTPGFVLLIDFLACFLRARYMIWTRKIGKRREREKILNLVRLKRTERVLDVGCGRGLLLKGAARAFAKPNRCVLRVAPELSEWTIRPSRL